MKTFSFTRPILALLSMCAFCYASLSAQILDSTKADSVQKPSAQTLDSTKADSVQKARENWYWVHGSFFGGIGIDTKPFSGGILTGGDAGLSIVWQSSIISIYTRGGILLNGGGRGGILSVFEPYSATYGMIERTDTTFRSISFGLGRIYSFQNDVISQISIIGEIQAGAKTNGIGVGWGGVYEAI